MLIHYNCIVEFHVYTHRHHIDITETGPSPGNPICRQGQLLWALLLHALVYWRGKTVVKDSFWVRLFCVCNLLETVELQSWYPPVFHVHICRQIIHIDDSGLVRPCLPIQWPSTVPLAPPLLDSSCLLSYSGCSRYKPLLTFEGIRRISPRTKFWWVRSRQLCSSHNW